MPHLNLDLDYFEHPKTLRLIGLLGKGAEVLPLKLWRYCGKYHAEDGKLVGYSKQEIEAAAGWWGEAGKAVDSLVTVIFLDELEDGYQVHDWLELQGHIAAYKRKGRDMAIARWGGASGNPDSNAASNAASNAVYDDVGEGQQCHNQHKQPTSRGKKRVASSGEDLATIELPNSLQTDKFRAAWIDWIAHRREIKHPMNPTMARTQIRKFEAWGPDYSAEVIENTIAHGWWGLREPEQQRPANGQHSRPSAFDTKKAAVEKALKERIA